MSWSKLWRKNWTFKCKIVSALLYVGTLERREKKNVTWKMCPWKKSAHWKDHDFFFFFPFFFKCGEFDTLTVKRVINVFDKKKKKAGTKTHFPKRP